MRHLRDFRAFRRMVLVVADRVMNVDAFHGTGQHGAVGAGVPVEEIARVKHNESAFGRVIDRSVKRLQRLRKTHPTTGAVPLPRLVAAEISDIPEIKVGVAQMQSAERLGRPHRQFDTGHVQNRIGGAEGMAFRPRQMPPEKRENLCGKMNSSRSCLNYDTFFSKPFSSTYRISRPLRRRSAKRTIHTANMTSAANTSGLSPKRT